MDVLLLIDLQNDFMPGGALAVADGDAVVSVANRAMERFNFVVATQDWHPPNHVSFAANHTGKKPGDVIDLAGLPQILWPVHCVRDTLGAELRAGLSRHGISCVIQKGTDSTIDSYSGFFDNSRRKATGLEDVLRERGATRLFVMGLATDYCVKFTVFDALSMGFETHVIVDGCRGVNLQSGDSERAIAAMKKLGAIICSHGEMG